MLHVVHGFVVAVGVLIVGYLLLPRDRRSVHQIERLRLAADRGTLTDEARQRAAELLAGASDSRIQVLGRGSADPREQAERRWLYAAACSSVLAAVVHAAVGPEHFHEAVRFGVFFVLLSIAQLAFAPMVVRRPSAGLLMAAAGLNALVVLIWCLTRTVGLPFALAEVEGVGWPDLLATTAELILIASCLVVFAGTVRRPEQVPLRTASLTEVG